MSIKDLREKIKVPEILKNPYLPSISDDVFYGSIIILVAIASFGLGRLSKIEEGREPVIIESSTTTSGHSHQETGGIPLQKGLSQGASVIQSISGQTSSETQLVASKNGTKYHYLWCSGAKTISEENKIYFTSKAEAEAKGYTPASNCKGL